ncbi:hypothetical protein GQ457_14G006290 [Hibiscus cannabinus]
MARGEDLQINTAKRAYRKAREEGNRQEEARWANVIGDILKNRGEYVEALKWFRIDYDVSNKYLPEKQLLPTCQSLGEVYLRLEHYKEALIYQKKHLELAKDANDLVEQQRASTQLGRTYHEMFLKSDGDHYSVQNAKKYFKSAMKLAWTLKENPPNNTCSFLKEYIDAHNNIGMLEMDLDNLGEALKFLTKGLEICDEEEVIEDDDGRSRLHHNLGNVYMELRRWDKAREHIEKDIMICKRIGHCQGEAKGYINLGELHYRHREFAKRKKRIASELCDKEKLSDAFLVVGESYQKLRDFSKAIKWYKRSWEGYKAIKNLEGQALAKINIGDILDCNGDWTGALEAFKEGYRSFFSNYSSFQNMVEDIGQFGPGMKAPTMHELRVPLLKKEVDDTQKLMEDHKKEWVEKGYSILSDGWRDSVVQKDIVNFLVNSPKGSMFVKSIDVSEIVKDAKMLFQVLDAMVEEVGKKM